MEKLWLLALSLLCVISLSCSQSAVNKVVADPCSSQRFQDSLITKYLDNGAHRFSYLDPRWTVYCDSLIAICPNIARAYQQKAIPLIKDGLLEEAFLLENKAVALDPKRWLAYRGYLKCIKTKDYEGAILDFQKAAQLTPNGLEMDHTYPFFEGLCNLELGNYSQAEANFKKDIFIQKGVDGSRDVHFNTLFYVGVLYFEMKQHGPAKAYLEQCLQAYKQHPDANYYLALTHRAQGNNELARQYLNTARQALAAGYRLNEDNIIYNNYPYQITAYEVQQALR